MFKALTQGCVAKVEEDFQNTYKIWRYKNDGDKKYKSDVYNQMKPKWLFSEVASHDLIKRFNILWFMPFDCLNEMIYMVNV